MNNSVSRWTFDAAVLRSGAMATALAALVASSTSAFSQTVPPGAAIETVAKAIRTDPALRAPVRGSLTLYDRASDITDLRNEAGLDQVKIEWRSSAPNVVSDSDRQVGADVIKRGSVNRQARDTMVRLTATLTAPGAAPMTLPVNLNVLAKPAASAIDTTAYFLAYFTGDWIDGEKLRFAVSEGNNALQWDYLNNGNPIIESTKGTLGLRDPYVMRSVEGDRFFMLATDLSVGRTGWGDSTSSGSHDLEIWESTDLVNWGAQRHVKVNIPSAGMTWAPEATYDPSIDAYVVYWTSSLYKDDAHREPDGNGPQILYSITRDFRNFTTPQPWFKSADLGDLVQQNGMIDSTVMQEGGQYYRFTKMTLKDCPSPDIIGQRSPSLRATMATGDWTFVNRCIARSRGLPEMEGPEAFVANKGDTSGFRYFLWVDNYGGGGYIPLGATSLQGSEIQWTLPASWKLPASPRHGSILRITALERDRLAAKWNPSLLVKSVQPVSLGVDPSTRQAALPGTVTAKFADNRVAPIGVRWAAIDWAEFDKRGVVRVTGTLVNSAATPAVATLVRQTNRATQ